MSIKYNVCMQPRLRRIKKRDNKHKKDKQTGDTCISTKHGCSFPAQIRSSKFKVLIIPCFFCMCPPHFRVSKTIRAKEICREEKGERGRGKREKRRINTNPK